MNIYSQDDLLELASRIYALDVVLHPDWDLQKKARESFKTAMQFFLAAQAESSEGKSWIGSAAPDHLHSTSQTLTEALAQAHHQRPLQPGSTTQTQACKPETGSTAAAAAATDPGTAPAEGTGSTSTQSQREHSTRAIQEQQFAPYDEHAT